MPTKIKFGTSAIWMPIMYRLGVKEAKVILKIVRCYVKPTIGQKVIDNE
jgi:hypothetical protein